ncbi:type II 3-dehydroquinate dehydratase [Neomicrococcus lactis]|uniref:type II 3-dehydroquinate dehydratase n=1 Tax=Neomicrococcus lactis TaxID=732241 RepID=UPI0023008894|nr:type II 3-dehydroquinate dehydratase [Neomicrococcus lactis]
MSCIMIINGPNLNLLGKREPEIYGTTTLAEIQDSCQKLADERGVELEFLQSNHEGAIIDWIHEARERCDAILINPGAFTHTSVAIRDALSAFNGPKVECHLSNVHTREEFRHRSYISPVVNSIIIGAGWRGYPMGLNYLIDSLADKK